MISSADPPGSGSDVVMVPVEADFVYAYSAADGAYEWDRQFTARSFHCNTVHDLSFVNFL